MSTTAQTKKNNQPRITTLAHRNRVAQQLRAEATRLSRDKPKKMSSEAWTDQLWERYINSIPGSPQSLTLLAEFNRFKSESF